MMRSRVVTTWLGCWTALLLLAASTAEPDDCLSHFVETFGDEPAIVENKVYLTQRPTPEQTAVDTLLGTVKWAEEVFEDPVSIINLDTQLGNQYLEPTPDNNQRTIEVKVKDVMEGLPDYPTITVELQLGYKFVFNTSYTCELWMIFPLEDENTNAPEPDSFTYTASIREDFPVGLTIPDLQMNVLDLDGTAPNNVLTVTFDPSCPLETNQPSYDASGGERVPITLILRQKVDYDTMDSDTIVCEGSIKDGAAEPEQLSAPITVTLTVIAYDDEPPVFDNQFYSAVLDQLEAPDAPLPVMPHPLYAEDQDKPPQIVQYSMTSQEGAEWDEFFQVDPNSGEVSQVTDLTEDDLGTEFSVHFLVTATDASGDDDTTILEITLPSPPTTSTTTSTTTTITTDTPQTTYPQTTETSATCPPCDTSSAFWSTSSPSSAPDTSTTSVTHSPTSAPDTSPSSETSPQPMTTTEEISTCPPCTTDISTCPTVTTDQGTQQPSSQTEDPTTNAASSASTATVTSPSAGITDSSSFTIITVPTSDLTCPTSTTCDCSTSSTSDGTSATETTPSVSPGTATSTDAASTPTSPTGGMTSSTSGSDPTTDQSQSSSKTTTDPALTPSSSSSSAVSTTTEGPTGPRYRFGLQGYNYEPFLTSSEVGQLTVVTVSGDEVTEGVIYRWDTTSEDEEFFSLDESTGKIRMQGEDLELRLYQLQALAEVEGEQVSPGAQVYITVLSHPLCDDIYIAQPVMDASVTESDGNGTVVANVTTQDDNQDIFCITNVTPRTFKDNFDITDSGELLLQKAIDVDDQDLGERSVVVRVRAMNGTCPEVPQGGDMERSEALVYIALEDENDNAPKLEGVGQWVAYPSNSALQQVQGHVLTVQVVDPDTTGDITVTLEGNQSSLFHLEEGTDRLYLTDPALCGDSCSVSIVADDGLNETIADVEVLRLETSNIHSLTMTDKTTVQIEEEIVNLSENIGLVLNLLYISLEGGSQVEASRRVKAENTRENSFKKHVLESRNRLKEEEAWTSIAHIYGFNPVDGSFISLDELNAALIEAGEEVAEEFSEKDVFQPPAAEDVTGYQVAVGVMGALLALVLVAGVLGYVYYRRKQRDNTRRPSAPLDVNTIGAAYPNHGYETTEMNELDTTSSSSGSVRQPSLKQVTTEPSSSIYEDVRTAALVTTFSEPSYDNDAGNDGAYSKVPTSNKYDQDKYEGDYSAVYGGAAVSVVANERKTSQHSISALRRIDPGPSPDGAKSSPYLTGSEGDYQTSRHTDTDKVESFTAYKGGEGANEETAKDRPPLYKKKSSTNIYNDNSLKSNKSDKSSTRLTSDTEYPPAKQTKIDTSPYAFPVRQKKEPPNHTTAAPAKPIMKAKKESVPPSTSDNTSDTPIPPKTPSPTTFSKLKTSPPPKRKGDTPESEDKRKSSKSQGSASEGDTTDGERKKSVVFKVLVDQKEIARADDSQDENDDL